MIAVRPAVEADIAAMSAVMTASITELCAADHHDDPQSIAGWTRNKTPEGVTRMLANPAQRFFVAEREGDVAAVGAVSDEGVVTLNYVSPRHRYRGVSRALLAHLEQVLAAMGHAEARLVSTTTAHRFYLDAGWVEDGPPDTTGFAIGYPTRKRLSSSG